MWPTAGLSHQVPRTPHPLQAAGHAARRLQLHHQVHRADVNAQFQRAGADQRRQLAGLELLFQFQAHLFGDAPVVGAEGSAHLAGAEHPLGFGHAAGE